MDIVLAKIRGGGRPASICARLASVWLAIMLVAACNQGSGLDYRVDGSSIEAFQNSLNELEQQLTAADYRQFKTAVNYLQINAFDYNTIEEFYQSLDGMTVTRIILRADQLRQEKSAGQ